MTAFVRPEGLAGHAIHRRPPHQRRRDARPGHPGPGRRLPAPRPRRPAGAGPLHAAPGRRDVRRPRRRPGRRAAARMGGRGSGRPADRTGLPRGPRGAGTVSQRPAQREPRSTTAPISGSWTGSTRAWATRSSTWATLAVNHGLAPEEDAHLLAAYLGRAPSAARGGAPWPDAHPLGRARRDVGRAPIGHQRARRRLRRLRHRAPRSSAPSGPLRRPSRPRCARSTRTGRLPDHGARTGGRHRRGRRRHLRRLPPGQARLARRRPARPCGADLRLHLPLRRAGRPAAQLRLR